MGPSDLPLLFGRFRVAMVLVLLLLVISSSSRGAGGARAEDRNTAFSPCDDTTVLKGDGFTFGLLIGSNASFFLQNNRTTQVSPCSLHPEGNLFSTRLSVFRPKVDEISLLIVNYTQVNPVSSVSLSLSLSLPSFYSKISETVNMEDLWHMSTKP